MKLFGTDGIRSRAGEAPLEAGTIARVGAALARRAHESNGGRDPRLLVGRDTRESGGWIEQALARGVGSQGGHVISAGVIPTPAVAYLTRDQGFDYGVVISASHNPFEDNGIKVFSGAGEKLTEALEAGIEQMVADGSWDVPASTPPDLEAVDLRGPYVAHLHQILASAGRLAGVKLVIDCAHGATATVAPDLFRDLGFDVDAIGCAPDGRNINLGCGSTHLESLQARVRETGAALGIAFDGDGDRALFVDHEGRPVDGDAVMFIIARHLAAGGRLPGGAIVATVMSNIGLELALRDLGVSIVRCGVGDKYVMEEMLARGLALGGEQSGHVIVAEHLFTGDGIATALQLLRIVEESGQSLETLAAGYKAYPQVLRNVRVRQKQDYTSVPPIAAVIADVEGRLAGQGRLLIRYSGTEPLLRIMIEGPVQDDIVQWADAIAAAVQANLA
ncbi:MAG: phosphoglucosamine mutase [Vicinamibacterales bacterium]